MVFGSNPRSDGRRAWSPTLFLVGGVLAVGHAVMMGVQTFTAVATPPDVFAPAAHLLVFAGLLGVSQTLRERSPGLARVGGGCAVLGMVGFAAITVGILADVAGVTQPAWFAVFVTMASIGMVPGFVAVGIASLRTEVHSRTVGVLLLTPAALFIGLLLAVLVLEASAVGGLLLGSGLATSYLTIGYSLRSGITHAGNAPATGPVTTG